MHSPVDRTGARTADEIAAGVLARVSAPTFPDRTLPITDVGAVADGRRDCTEPLRRAIAMVATEGGGRVLVPAGHYRTGAVQLLDNVELHLAEGAVLEFSRDPGDFLPLVRTWYEGIECYNYAPMVSAYRRRNVALTGRGVLDGRADAEHWWNWAGGTESTAKQQLREAAAAGAPVSSRTFGDRAPLRPGMVEFSRCDGVLIDGVTVRNAPMWVLHPVQCRNVIIQDVRVRSLGPNNDGCNPECCSDVLITGCEFDTGDDCIAIKAGKDADGRRIGVPSADVLITDCRMGAGHGGVTIGSETSGGINRVVAQHCRMDGTQLKRALRIKSNPNRGGFVHDIWYRDIEIGHAAQAVIEIALDYENLSSGDHPPDVARIRFDRIRAAEAEQALRLLGLPQAPIHDVRLTDCRFERMRSSDRIDHVRGLQFERLPERHPDHP